MQRVFKPQPISLWLSHAGRVEASAGRFGRDQQLEGLGPHLCDPAPELQLPHPPRAGPPPFLGLGESY